MARRRVVLEVDPSASAEQDTLLRDGIAAIQAELDVRPDFPAEVEAEAQRGAASLRPPHLDRTDLDFLTIDPASSLDLDQALHIERAPARVGYVVHYAIADVAAFVDPGSPVDVEAHRRGETLYGANSKIPLHPRVLSEAAASLLPDATRPAMLWTVCLDSAGEPTSARVERAAVRSRARLSYAEAQRALDDGTAGDVLLLLREVGRLRQAREAARGGVSLPLPEQEVVLAEGAWSVEFRTMLPVEEWNAQISLLTGMTAASMMLEGGVGLLRTLPAPEGRDVERLRRTALALSASWPEAMSYPDFVRSLDPALPSHAAVLLACTRLLRGAGYVAFNGDRPEQPQHSAVGATYAHVTAPLRRLGDRYALEICASLSAGLPVPGWVLERLEGLPDTLRESGRRANQYENAVVDLVETAMLRSRVGQWFSGVIVQRDDKDERRGSVTIQDPAVEAPVRGSAPLPLGTQVVVELAVADVTTRRVEFTWQPDLAGSDQP